MEGTGVEWSGVEGMGGKGRAGQGRVPDCLGGLSRVGISSAQHARGTGSRLVLPIHDNGITNRENYACSPRWCIPIS